MAHNTNFNFTLHFKLIFFFAILHFFIFASYEKWCTKSSRQSRFCVWSVIHVMCTIQYRVRIIMPNGVHSALGTRVHKHFAIIAKGGFVGQMKFHSLVTGELEENKWVNLLIYWLACVCREVYESFLGLLWAWMENDVQPEILCGSPAVSAID